VRVRAALRNRRTVPAVKLTVRAQFGDSAEIDPDP